MILYPKLEDLKNQILLEWSQGRPFILQAGHRAGVTTMAQKLVHEVEACEAPSPSVFWVCSTVQAAKQESLYLAERGVKVNHKTSKQLLDSFAAALRNRKPDPVKPYDVVVIDCAFRDPQGEALFCRVAKNTCRVLAMGSADDTPWTCDPIIHKYATWDLNPYIERADLEDTFARDPARATRDYDIPKRRAR